MLAVSVILYFFFFFNDTATTEIYTVMNTLSLHDALPISTRSATSRRLARPGARCRGVTERRSEEHTSELQSLITISYAVFCLKKKKKKQKKNKNQRKNKKKIKKQKDTKK